MSNNQKDKITILQYRTDRTEEHEIECFRKGFSQSDLDLNFINAVQEDFNLEILEDSSGLIIGGSTEFNLTAGHGKGDWLGTAYDLIDQALTQEIPTLGICFGFQLLTIHQGGKLINNSQYHETGSYEISLNQPANDCEIFSKLPETFTAQLGHKDTPTQLPENSYSLAKSEVVPHQAFRLKEKPVWGVLFHPELNQVTAKERLSMFLDYPIDSKEFLEKIGEIKESSISAEIVHHFIDYAVQNNS
jgi:GMP synthase (glutamine-hydrolysing)